VPTLLILASKLGYQTRAFADAAAELALEVAYGTDRCHQLNDPWGDRALPLHFEDPEASAAQIVEFARTTPLTGIVALGDRPTPTAARACAALGLPFHSTGAADTCRDKYSSRTVLRDAGLQVPQFVRVPAVDAAYLQDVRFPFPWVLKPLSLSGSRGVIRANNLEEAQAAFDRIGAVLRSPEIGALREPSSDFIQIEQYVDGIEVAIEALVDHGELKLLAIFDKPDLLTGPYFEEIIYLTPSRLPLPVQQQIQNDLRRAANALGLSHGPVHAELRIELDPATGNVRNMWIMEVAARCIGGLCARSLRFSNGDQLVSLENLLVRLALAQPVRQFAREPKASGVMMIPIPAEGIYEDVSGVEHASTVEHIEAVEITAKPGQKVVPLPEGSSYLGFIFARAADPEEVEHALRAAHSRLEFTIAPALPVLSGRR
jgi:biotin carboxylase